MAGETLLTSRISRSDELKKEIAKQKPEITQSLRSIFQQKIFRSPGVSISDNLLEISKQTFFIQKFEFQLRELELGKQEISKSADVSSSEKEDRKENVREREKERAEAEREKEREKVTEALRSPEEIVERTQEIIESAEGVREIIDVVRVVNKRGVQKETIVARVKEVVAKEGKRIEEEVPKQKVVVIEKIAEKIFTKSAGMTKKELIKEVKKISELVPADIGRKLKDAVKEMPEREKEYLVSKLQEMVGKQREYVAVKSELVKLLEKAVKDKAFDKEQLLKELGKLAERSKSAIGQEISSLLKEGEKAEVKVEQITDSLRKLIDSYKKRIEIVDPVSELVKRSEELTKEQIVEGLRKIVEDWQDRVKFVDAVVQWAEKLLPKRVKAEEFAKKTTAVIDSVVKQNPKFEELGQALKRIIGTGKEREESPSAVLDKLREVSDGMATNPYVRKVREIVGQSKRLEKKDVVEQLKKLKDELKESQWVVERIDKLVKSPEGADKQKLLDGLKDLLWSVSSDRLGKEILELIHNEKKYGLTREQLVEGLATLLQREERMANVMRAITVSVERKDVRQLNKIANMLGIVLNDLRNVNGVAKRLSTQEWDKDAKEKMYSVVDEFVRSLQSMAKNGRKEAGKLYIEELFEGYLNKEVKLEDLRGTLDEIFNGKETSLKIEAMRGLEQLVKTKKITGFDNNLLEYSKKSVKEPDVELKSITFITLGRYADYTEAVHDGKTSAKTYDEIGKIIVDGAKGSNYRVITAALKAADKVAARSNAASSFIKIWCGKTVPQPIRSLALDIAKAHKISIG